MNIKINPSLITASYHKNHERIKNHIKEHATKIIDSLAVQFQKECNTSIKEDNHWDYIKQNFIYGFEYGLLAYAHSKENKKEQELYDIGLNCANYLKISELLAANIFVKGFYYGYIKGAKLNVI